MSVKELSKDKMLVLRELYKPSKPWACSALPCSTLSSSDHPKPPVLLPNPALPILPACAPWRWGMRSDEWGLCTVQLLDIPAEFLHVLYQLQDGARESWIRQQSICHEKSRGKPSLALATPLLVHPRWGLVLSHPTDLKLPSQPVQADALKLLGTSIWSSYGRSGRYTNHGHSTGSSASQVSANLLWKTQNLLRRAVPSQQTRAECAVQKHHIPSAPPLNY